MLVGVSTLLFDKGDSMDKYAQLFERDMAIRGLTESTRGEYLRRVRKFGEFIGRPPAKATLDDVNNYQYHLTREKKVSWSYFNQAVGALKFFFGTTLKKKWGVEHIPYARRTGRKLPVILSQEEVVQCFTAIPLVKYRVALMTIYATGLRIGETLRLKVTDIDSNRMVVRVEQGKGRKDRYVMLSPVLLTILREYWKIARPKTWLFQHRFHDAPIGTRSMARVVQKARAVKISTVKRVIKETRRPTRRWYSMNARRQSRKVSIRMSNVVLQRESMA